MSEMERAGARAERAALVGFVGGSLRRPGAEQSLNELASLAAAAGASVTLRAQQERARPNAATVLGRGKVEMLAARCAASDVELVIFDNDLTPAQLRNLEGALGCRVIDRTQLILDIFARRARTREGKLQVELAQLRYLLPRLVGAGAMLSRLGGGIGTRGPGETQLETDRRRIRQRIGTLAREIDRVRRRRAQLRERRHKTSVPTAALVGYTNAGKTTLFNQLTRERATTSDTLFVTLDPLVRQVKLPDGRRLLVSDTVGFIERLPHALVAAFRATLEEVAEADVLLHVIDASGPDRERQVAAVRRVLAEMDAARVPVIPVYNKCDRLDAAALERLRPSDDAALCVSALRGDGCRELLEAVSVQVALDTRRVRLEFDASSEVDRRRIASLYRHGRVHRHVAADGRVSIEADVPRRLLATLTDQRP